MNLNDLAYARSALKWKLTATTSAAARLFEPAKEKLSVPAPARISEVDADMDAAVYSGQSWGEIDSFPSPERVAFRFTQPGKRIGDCQSFAVYAAARLSLLPPSEGIDRVELSCLRLDGLIKPTGGTRSGGHAVCLYRRRRPEGLRWGVMQQAGRLRAYESREQAVEAVALAFHGRLLWWCRLGWPELGCLQITRCQSS